MINRIKIILIKNLGLMNKGESYTFSEAVGKMLIKKGYAKGVK